MSRCVLLLLIVSSLGVLPSTDASAIPIWELLTHEEKMGRLFYVFVHLVEQYCKTSDIPDCPKVLTLYGMSNLVSESEHSLNLMDPYQRDAKTIVWERIMRGEFKLPSKLTGGKPSKPSAGLVKPDLDNEVYATPYEVRVRPPSAFVPYVAGQPSENDSSASKDSSAEDSSITILRLKRSLQADDSLPILSEREAQQLSRLFQ